MDKPTGSHLDLFLKLPATNRRVGDNHHSYCTVVRPGEPGTRPARNESLPR